MQHGHLLIALYLIVQITETKVQYYSVRMTTYPRVLVIKQHFLKEYLTEIVFTRIYLGEKCQCALFNIYIY